ncbi:putative splicing factor SF3a60 [Cardamine amara subsp. amara]|uniref:Splicing factor SF3a60 n=1 Tax=Cardamine amara subsp. amara TaxID=228776 RepID=A0ABD0ZU05_CARAN
MADQSSKPLQFFVRLLDGKSVTLTFNSPLAYGDQIKQRIFEQTKIPTHLHRLICGGYQISDESSISQSDATVNLVLSLRGGKGGFGSLLRGAATKAGQKKTNNFDACRDMSGRRLRHVNAEKRLEEWKEGEEERKLEKLAHEFLKKQAKKVKQGVGNGATQKYVKKYREESDKCIEAVELALKESFQNGKRKGKMIAESDKSKRLKIWKGKRAVKDSDSDDSSDEEDEKYVVLNNGSQVVSGKDTDESSGSVVTGPYDGDSSGKASCNSGSEEEKDIVVHQSSDVQVVNEEKMDDSPVAVADVMGHTEKEEKSSDDENKNLVEVASETLVTSVAVNNKGSDSEVKTGGAAGETECVGAVCCKPVEPLNFDDFNSATDMEVLGMERLKTELQSYGLKCGGTLQERAARLFLLKSTPLDKLPKKLLAKK